MNIIKLEHACLDIKEGTSRLIIDPGNWTNPLKDYSGITVLVITHVHQDHLDEEKVKAIIAQNPDLQIFGTQQVADALEGNDVTVPEVGKQYDTGDFKLEFFGGKHELIMDSWPQDENFGVLVNDKLYYAGDSFSPCPKPHTVLAAPAAAPWMKISEAADFIIQDGAEQVFPTHNAIINEAGQGLADRILGGVAEQSGKKYAFIKPGDSIDV